MAEIEIVRIPVAPENGDALLAVVNDARSGYLAPPACLGVDVSLTGGEVVVIVRWASQASHKARGASPEAGAFFGAVMALAAGPPSLEAFIGSGGRLAGKVALVTGGASGIGRAVVDRFVAEGAKVGVVDVNAAGLAEVAAAHGAAVMTIAADLRGIEGNVRAVAETVAAFGKLDTYVANAGMFDGFFEFASTSLDQLDAGFDPIFGVNVRALILGCRAALPALVGARGSIIVTLSNSSLYPDGGGVMYVASKHAALGVMRQLAHELAPVVRVNAVAPGATKTPIGVPDAFGGPIDQTAPEISAAIAGVVPAGIHADAQDHAAAYVLLAADDESRVMTGTVIESDGGLGIRGLRRVRGGDTLNALFAKD
jgi:NAD(P)-dependent dehydrogenase (short-subunit alcohol dehydrogenase family)/quinol monooxygenase YgiN